HYGGTDQPLGSGAALPDAAVDPVRGGGGGAGGDRHLRSPVLRRQSAHERTRHSNRAGRAAAPDYGPRPEAGRRADRRRHRAGTGGGAGPHPPGGQSAVPYAGERLGDLRRGGGDAGRGWRGSSHDSGTPRVARASDRGAAVRIVRYILLLRAPSKGTRSSIAGSN